MRTPIYYSAHMQHIQPANQSTHPTTHPPPTERERERERDRDREVYEPQSNLSNNISHIQNQVAPQRTNQTKTV